MAYDVRIRSGDRYTGGNCFIVAPASSFELQEKPKDPLMFYKINEAYFYLVHKWGNDLSAIRRVYPVLANHFVSWFICVPVPVFLLWLTAYKLHSSVLAVMALFFTIFGVIASTATIIGEQSNRKFPTLDPDWTIRLVNKNDWDSPMK